jgi:hypothetical protein
MRQIFNKSCYLCPELSAHQKQSQKFYINKINKNDYIHTEVYILATSFDLYMKILLHLLLTSLVCHQPSHLALLKTEHCYW